jgi:sigma-B regulation protein RsbU (phosphoserine phosphatase)
VHIPDIATYGAAINWRDAQLAQTGARAALAVPLLRDGDALGAILIRRRSAGPFSDQQIRLLQSFADQAVIAIENTRLFAELRERDDRRRQELERASAIQQRLLPDHVEGWPGLLEIAVRFRPAVETSGDFYDVLALTPAAASALSPLQIAVGDVAGKGMSAALVTALARAALRSSASVPTEMVTPAGTLRLAGRRLHQDVGAGHFVACALAVVEPPGELHRGPRLKLSNAAQVPVLLCRNGTAAEIEPPGDRLPLGVRADGDYEDTRVELRPGDVVVFASDGLPEAPAQSPVHLPSGSAVAPPAQPGELFGFERLAQSAAHCAARAQNAEAVAAGIWSDVTVWAGQESHHDDMTLLVLRVPLSR